MMEVRANRTDPAAFISVFGEDRGPVPHVTEDASEAAWLEYDACCAALDAQLQQLRGALQKHPPRAHARLRDIEARFSAQLARGVDVDQVMAIARTNARVCPQPGPWRSMYLLLPMAREAARLVRAPYPVDLREWYQTTDLQKQLRLREQLEWAEAHDALARVREFLAGLREADWHHAQPMDWPTI